MSRSQSCLSVASAQLSAKLKGKKHFQSLKEKQGEGHNFPQKVKLGILMGLLPPNNEFILRKLSLKEKKKISEGKLCMFKHLQCINNDD